MHFVCLYLQSSFRILMFITNCFSYRRQYRYPKPVFEYSPESRSPYSYNITPTTKLVSNPQTPTNKYGRKICDKGMETLERNIIKEPNDILWYSVDEGKHSPEPLRKDSRERRNNKLYSVAEVEDNNSTTKSQIKPAANSIKSLRREILTMGTNIKTIEPPDQISSINGNHKNTSTTTDLEKDSRKEKNNKDEKSEKHEEEHSEKKSKTQKFLSTIKRGGRGHTKHESKAEKAYKPKGDVDKDINDNNKSPVTSEVVYRDTHNASKARPTTMYDSDLQEDDGGEKEKDDRTENKPTKKDSQRNSLFLDDDVTRKNKSSSSFHEYIPGQNIPLKERLRRKQQEQIEQNGDATTAVVPERSLAQRASKIIRAKYHGNDDTVESSVKLSDSHKDINNTNSNSSLTSKFFRRFKGGEKEINEKEKQPATKDENKASVTRRRMRTKSNDDDITATTTSEITTATEAETFKTDKNHSTISVSIQDGTTNDEPIKDTVACNEASLTALLSKEYLDNEEANEQLEKELDSNRQSAEKQDRHTPVVYRRKKKKTEEDVNLSELKRKSLFVYEEEIVPDKKTAQILRLNFRSPERSREEVDEDVLVEANVRQSEVLNDDIFDCLKEKAVNEDGPMVIESRQEIKIDDSLFDKLDQITPPPPKEDNEDDVFFNSEGDSHIQEQQQQQQQRHSETSFLQQFIEPIEQENAAKIQHLDSMFDEIESANNQMYEELLNLSKPESIGGETQDASVDLNNDNIKPNNDNISVLSDSLTESNINSDATFSEQDHNESNQQVDEGKQLENDLTRTSAKYLTEENSEIEEARKDVHQMLMNCESIDKINNSLNDINPPETISNNQEIQEADNLQNVENEETDATKSKDSAYRFQMVVQDHPGDSHVADEWVEVKTPNHQERIEESHSPTISEYATPPKSPEGNDAVNNRLSTSPFTFSFQRPASTTPQDKKKRSSYLEKRQSHLGLFSLKKSSSLNKLSTSLTSLLSISDKNSPQTPPDRSSARSASPNIPDSSSSPLKGAESTTSVDQKEPSASYLEKRQSLGFFSLSKSSSLSKLSASLSSLLSISDKSSPSPVNQSTRSPSPSVESRSASRETNEISMANTEETSNTNKCLEDREAELVIRSIDSYCTVTCKFCLLYTSPSPRDS